MKNTAENPRKTNYFVSIVSTDDSGKITYDKKDFVELTGDMIEWLIELNANNPDGKIKQVEELIIKAQKMLDSEDL